MAQLGRLCAELALPGRERARKPIADYLRTLPGYRNNAHRGDPPAWGFAVDARGYRPLNATGG